MAPPLKVGAVMYDPKVSVIWEIIRDFFDGEGAPIDVAFYSTYEDQNDGLLSGAIDTPGTRRSPGSTRSGDPATAAARSLCGIPIAIASPISWRGAAVPYTRSPT